MNGQTKLAVENDYLELVKEFPLRPLKNKKEHERAMGVYARFAGRTDLTAGEDDYVDALTHFIEDFEVRQKRDEMRKFSPLELLKHLMEVHEMSTDRKSTR